MKRSKVKFTNLKYTEICRVIGRNCFFIEATSIHASSSYSASKAGAICWLWCIIEFTACR